MPKKTVAFISQVLMEELREAYGEYIPEKVTKVSTALAYISDATGNRFVIIVDEWDVLIRDESTNKIAQEEYIDFLRSLFKGIEPTRYIALAFMTGILPIKKIQNAVCVEQL